MNMATLMSLDQAYASQCLVRLPCIERLATDVLYPAAAIGFIAPLVCAAAPYPCTQDASAKRYAGVILNVLTLAPPVLGDPVVQHAKEFEQLTGARINVTRVPFDVLPSLEPRPHKMLDSPGYGGVLPRYKRIANWGNREYMVPAEGSLRCRRDLLEDTWFKATFRTQTAKQLGAGQALHVGGAGGTAAS
jgi:multiple sugar transport system substrate-binding protein